MSDAAREWREWTQGAPQTWVEYLHWETSHADLAAELVDGFIDTLDAHERSDFFGGNVEPYRERFVGKYLAARWKVEWA